VRRLLRVLHRVISGCAKVPLVAAFAVMAVAASGQLWAPDPHVSQSVAPAAVEILPEDFSLIDRVLARRAPELGITLRRQVGVAIAEEARVAGYDPLLILAIIDVESDFEEAAISHRGARGLMQIKPSTLYFLAQRTGLRLSRQEVASDPALGVRLGIRYLRWLNDRFGSLDLALMAYNAGPRRIRNAIKQGALDAYRRYPTLVRRDFRRFRVGVGLGGDWALALRQTDDLR
jgi:soluble lytic murein transglycosylase